MVGNLQRIQADQGVEQCGSSKEGIHLTSQGLEASVRKSTNPNALVDQNRPENNKMFAFPRSNIRSADKKKYVVYNCTYFYLHSTSLYKGNTKKFLPLI